MLPIDEVIYIIGNERAMSTANLAFLLTSSQGLQMRCHHPKRVLNSLKNNKMLHERRHTAINLFPYRFSRKFFMSLLSESVNRTLTGENIKDY